MNLDDDYGLPMQVGELLFVQLDARTVQPSTVKCPSQLTRKKRLCGVVSAVCYPD